MRFVRVGDSPALPTEKILWGDYDDSSGHEDDHKHGQADSRSKETDHPVRRKDLDFRVRDCQRNRDRKYDCGSTCRNENASKDLSISRDLNYAARSPRNHAPAVSCPRDKSSTRFEKINHDRFPPRISSSTRCYAPKDRHKSAGSERQQESGGRSVGDEVRIPSWSNSDRVRGAGPNRGPMRARAMGCSGMKRLERESDLCSASEYKRHSRSYGSQKHGKGRPPSNTVKTVELAPNVQLKQRSSVSEIKDEQSEGRLEGPDNTLCNLEATPLLPQHDLESKITADGEIEADPDVQKQYEMLASLLLEDPLDIEQDFELSDSSMQVDVQFCGSIFEDSIVLETTEAFAAGEMLDGIQSRRNLGSGGVSMGFAGADGEMLDDIKSRGNLVSGGEQTGFAGVDGRQVRSVSNDSGAQCSASISSFSPASTDAFSTARSEESFIMDAHTISPIEGVSVSKVCSKQTDSRCDPKKPADVPGRSGDADADASRDEAVSPSSRQLPSRVFVDVTNKFKIQTTAAVKEQVKENDPHRLSQRQRQIDFGKNTLGYERYSELVPRWKRTRKDPQTPNPRQVCSKRSWDGQIRKWRRLLHAYDPPVEEGEELPEEFGIFRQAGGLEPQSPDASDGCNHNTTVIPRGRKRYYGEEYLAHDGDDTNNSGCEKQKLIDKIKGTSVLNRHGCNKFVPQLTRSELHLSIYEDWTES